jgi:hypothetical protein
LEEKDEQAMRRSKSGKVHAAAAASVATRSRDVPKEVTIESGGIFLPRVLYSSKDSDSQEHHGPHTNPPGWHVHHMRAPDDPGEHDDESEGVECK